MDVAKVSLHDFHLQSASNSPVKLIIQRVARLREVGLLPAILQRTTRSIR
jgi:hypothetical protein